jgi:Predicted hydrolases or acyltransferases (alpha/beta hydrolase superfamily)
MSFTHAYVNVDGSRIYVIENSGKSEPNVVLFHGARFNAETWLGVGTLEALEKNDIRGISVDFPGYGKSEKGKWSDLADFVSDFLRVSGLQGSILLGPSMGGKAVLRYVIKGGRPRGLILVGAVGIDEVLSHVSSLNGIPLLLIWGREDSVSPVEDARELERRVSSAKLIFIGKQHACYLDDPEAFNEAVVEFANNLKED